MTIYKTIDSDLEKNKHAKTNQIMFWCFGDLIMPLAKELETK